MTKSTQAASAIYMVAMFAGLAGCDNTSKAPPPPPPVAKAPTAFTVGGAVSGLSGSGLVLQLNAANDLAINANGKFSFPKAVGKGAPYSVTVKAAPAAPIRQTCTVSQGQGSMATAAVSNIAVSCTTNSYAVGGMVSGLPGKGPGKQLVIQLNGTNDLALTKNGKFIFPAVRLPDGSDYSVAIKTTPAKRSCTIQPVSAAFDNETLNIVTISCAKKRR